jgi:hypothetical protein
VELLHTEVGGAELEFMKQSSPKHPHPLKFKPFFVLSCAKFLLSSYMLLYHQANESLLLLLHFRLTSPFPSYFPNVEVIAQIILMLIVV